MSEFILSSCSTADLTEKHFNSRGINYVCFHFMVHHFTTFHAPKGIKIQTTPNFLYD